MLREDNELLTALARFNAEVPRFAAAMMDGLLTVDDEHAFADRMATIAALVHVHADDRAVTQTFTPCGSQSGLPTTRSLVINASASTTSPPDQHHCHRADETRKRTRMTALHDDPLASASGRFALCGPLDAAPPHAEPSPSGARPWGLRELTVGPMVEPARPTVRFDHQRQIAVDANGRPLVVSGPPTANTTSTVDGEDGPSSEDWSNDFWPDDPDTGSLATGTTSTTESPAAGTDATPAAGGRR